MRRPAASLCYPLGGHALTPPLGPGINAEGRPLRLTPRWRLTTGLTINCIYPHARLLTRLSDALEHDEEVNRTLQSYPPQVNMQVIQDEVELNGC